MIFHTIGNIKSNIKCQALKSSKIWDRDAEQLTRAQLLVSFQLVKIKHNDLVAFEAFEAASMEALSDFILGKIESCDLLNFRSPRPNLSSERILELINEFEPTQRRMIMFALYTNLSLRDVGRLTYKSVKYTRNRSEEINSEDADYILRTQPRHLHTNFVFWEFNRLNNPSPFLTIEKEFLEQTNYLWGEFSQQVYLNFKYSCDNFKQITI